MASPPEDVEMGPGCSSQSKQKTCISSKHLGNFSSDTCKEMHFDIHEHKQDAFKVLQFMKVNNILTDVILEVKKERFYAHRVILSACSPYFKAMFTSGLKESDMDSIKLQGVEPKVMKIILMFMYTGELSVCDLLVCQLLSAATMFQMNHVSDACCKFLEKQMDVSNVIGISLFAQQNGCMNMYTNANFFIEQHFKEVSQQEEFLSLNECQLINLIQKDTLNVPDEMDVYNAVVKWIEHDEGARRAKMQHILRSVRCQYLLPTFLTEQMRNCRILKKVPQCREYLAKIFEDMTLHKPPQQRARQPNAPCVIYIVGGYSNRQSLDTLECYDIPEKKWTRLSNLPFARSGLAAAYVDGIFYVVGGRNIQTNGSYQDCNWVNAFDPYLNHWQERAPMIEPRNRLGIAVLDKQLFAVGGANGALCYNSVEKYNSNDNKWQLVRPMHMARMGVGVAVVCRLLYVIGGYDGERRLRSVECYYPESNKWSIVAPMQKARSGAGVCAIDKFIFVIGGYDGTNQLNSVEKYDVEFDTWCFAPPLSVCRSAMTVSVWDNKIFVMGGYDGNQFLSSVEVFDIKTESWSEGQPLPWGRSGHAAAASFHTCPYHSEQYAESTKF